MKNTRFLRFIGTSMIALAAVLMVSTVALAKPAPPNLAVPDQPILSGENHSSNAIENDAGANALTWTNSINQDGVKTNCSGEHANAWTARIEGATTARTVKTMNQPFIDQPSSDDQDVANYASTDENATIPITGATDDQFATATSTATASNVTRDASTAHLTNSFASMKASVARSTIQMRGLKLRN